VCYRERENREREKREEIREISEGKLELCIAFEISNCLLHQACERL
jgi:hypothetical protein